MEDSMEMSHDGLDESTIEKPEQNAASSPKKKRKRVPKNNVKSQFTIRIPPWQYMHLQHINSSAEKTVLDAMTAHLHLTAALSQFLGLHGAAIPIDILKIEGDEAWIRIPQEDRTVVSAAIGTWISSKGEAWRIKGTSSWSARAWARDGGQDLFDG